jgi:hypothetical protein
MAALRSPSRYSMRHSAVITTCPLVRKQAQESFYNKDPVARTPHPPHCRTQQTSFPLPQPLSADPTSPPPPNLASRPRQPHLAQEALFHNYINKSHQQVNRYICVICISHPTQTTSDTSRLSSCNHFAYRGNLVAHTSVATANTPPPRRMSR